MWKWVHDIDRLLRGEVTCLPALRTGKIDIDPRGLLTALVVLGGVYGFCMGWFALLNRDTPELWQVAASAIKVPALFLLTLGVTFPSLYVFNALVGSQLSAGSLLRLLLASVGVAVAVLASFATIVGFFSLTTESYPFMVVMNVLLFAIAGILGLVFLLQTLNRLHSTGAAPATPTAPHAATSESGVAESERSGALEQTPGLSLGRNVLVVFRCWVVVFALVGAQMSWVLRPFIGNPHEPFMWFRPRHSNFFESVWQSYIALFR